MTLHRQQSHLFPFRRQNGIALATAMIFLVVITLLGLVAVRSSTIELRLAQNEQVRVEALQTAQGIVDAVLANPNNTPVNSVENFVLCYNSGGGGKQEICPAEDTGLVLGAPGQPLAVTSGAATGNDCDPTAGLFATGVYAEARRLEPAEAPVPSTMLTSMDKFTTAAFAVRGQYACGNSGLGTADIEQGLIRLVPRINRIN